MVLVEITKANYKEVYARHKFINIECPITLKDVEDNIGLILMLREKLAVVG